MKKLIVLILGILIAFFFILGYAFDINGEYVKERALWHIHREARALSLHKESAPINAVERIAAKYDRFSARYSTSPLAPKAQLLKGELYLLKNDYDKARKTYQDIIAQYNYNADVVAHAMVSTARTYEQQQDWEKASAIYENVVKDYPLTAAGFMIPAYMGYYHLSNGRTKEADQAFDDAVMFYENVANYYPNTPLEQAAWRMTAECRLAQKRWEEALEATRKWMFKYPSNAMLFAAIKTIKEVCVGRLKEYDCAINTYKQFLVQNPGHPVRPMLQKVIGNLESLKADTTAMKTK
jgi:tetratricopeptide (TPR) repeat protein